MDCDHMQDRRQDEEEEKRHVQHMPECEHAIVHSEPRCLVDGGEIQIEMLSDEFQPLPAAAPADSARLSLSLYGLLRLPQSALADVIRTPSQQEKRPYAGEKAGVADNNTAFKSTKLGQYPLSSLEIAAQGVFQGIGIGQNGTDFCLGAVKAHMDLREQVSPDNPARYDDEHEEERHRTVERANPEVGVKKDQCWANNAEQHMRAEPARNPAKPAQKTVALSERIKQEDQHQNAADNAQPIAYARFRGEILLFPHHPAGIKGSYNCGSEEQRPEAEKRLGEIVGESADRDAVALPVPAFFSARPLRLRPRAP